MSAVTRRANWISPEEYLAGEPYSDVRHEYLDGEVYAMPGASTQHTRITNALLRALGNHLDGHPCEAFSHDLKVNIVDAGRQWYCYPDPVVCCDPSGLSDYACNTPAIIVEVFPSLHTYVLVAQKHRELTAYRKNEAGLWNTEILPGDGDALHLPQLGFSMTLDELYRRTGL